MSRGFKRLRFYASWPWLWLYFISGWRARVVVADEAGRILLVQGKWRLWYGDPGWSLPGGGIGHHEEAAGAAVRELAEELGVRLTMSDLHPLGRVQVAEHGIRYTAQLFRVEIASHTPLRLQAREIVAAEWYHPRDLAGIQLKPDVRRALELLGSAA